MKRTASPFAAATIGFCLVVAACGPKVGGASPSSASGRAPGSAHAQAGGGQTIDVSALPKPRAGLWQDVVDDGDGDPATMTICRSGNLASIKTPENCAKMSFTRTLTGQIVADMDCGSANGEMHMTMHSVSSGDFQNNVVSDGTMTMQMKGQPASTMKTHTESKYVGACPPGMKLDQVEDGSAPGPPAEVACGAPWRAKLRISTAIANAIVAGLN